MEHNSYNGYEFNNTVPERLCNNCKVHLTSDNCKELGTSTFCDNCLENTSDEDCYEEELPRDICLYRAVCVDKGCTCPLYDHTEVDRDIYNKMYKELEEEFDAMLNDD